MKSLFGVVTRRLVNQSFNQQSHIAQVATRSFAAKATVTLSEEQRLKTSEFVDEYNRFSKAAFTVRKHSKEQNSHLFESHKFLPFSDQSSSLLRLKFCSGNVIKRLCAKMPYQSELEIFFMRVGILKNFSELDDSGVIRVMELLSRVPEPGLTISNISNSGRTLQELEEYLTPLIETKGKSI